MSAAPDNGYGYPVGATRILVVGVEGTVEARDEAAGTVTINGHTLPLNLGPDRGVKYLSAIWPQDDPTTCDGTCQQSSGISKDDAGWTADEVERHWVDLIQTNHDREHDGPMRWCQHPLCAVADDRG